VPQGFTREQVERIAALANLELDEADLDLFARQLGEILAYASEVQQVDTTGVPPTSHVVTRHAAERPDELGPCLDIADVLANAPDADKDGGLFKVPRVITHGG
jgi:aspartyl-tRNA(Asn)/glutamyl-tRNA(Gln) amidotransferase subunit C